VALFSIVSALIWMGQGLRILAISGASMSSYFGPLGKEAVKMVPFALAMGAARLLTESALMVSATFVVAIGLFGLLRVRFILGRKHN
jgi:hypothetical protein